MFTVQDLEAETEKDEKQKREEMDQTPDMDTNMDFHRFDEQVLYCIYPSGLKQLSLQVNLVLESADPDKLKDMKRKFIRCSSLATITHLKKFLAMKVNPRGRQLSCCTNTTFLGTKRGQSRGV